MKCTMQYTDEWRGRLRKAECQHVGCSREVWLPAYVNVSVVNATCGISADTVTTPGLLARGLNYAEEYRKYFAAGRPRRSDEEIAKNQTICETCEFYVALKGRVHQGSCKLCGCTLNNNNSEFNKHYMGTTACPYPAGPKWLPIVDVA